MSEEKFRVESDLLGELKVPINAYYGVQTQRGINNYHISRKKMRDYPDYVVAIAYVKLAAVQTNHSLGVINDEISGAISQACQEIIDGKFHEDFPIESWAIRRASISIVILTIMLIVVRALMTFIPLLYVLRSSE